MAETTRKPARFKLPARIRNRRTASCNLDARMSLIDRIADLSGIETVGMSNETIPRRVEIYLRREVSDRASKRKAAKLLCSLDCNGMIVSGLDRWERYQVLANGWGKLTNDQVNVFLPRDHQEVEIVWSVLRRAYDNLFNPIPDDAGSLVVATWDSPKHSRTSLQ